jgi:hypothetical protein
MLFYGYYVREILPKALLFIKLQLVSKYFFELIIEDLLYKDQNNVFLPNKTINSLLKRRPLKKH